MPNFFSAVPLVTIIALSGCEGAMQGVVRGEGTRVQFQYEQGVSSDSYTAIVDEETFKGKAVFADSRSGYGFDSNFNSAVFSTTSGKIVATLFGDKNSTLRCNMTYADSSGFTSLGGVGVCQHSDGRIIDVIW